jgi:RNA polymerase sigma-70 factor, ECF subfamily
LAHIETDAGLVERVRHGDAQAYGALVTRYERPVLAAVLPVVRDAHAAQDVVQDVFVQCYLKLSRLRDPSRFGGWLLQAAGREAVHAARRGARSRLRVTPSDLTHENTPAAHEPASRLLDDERERLLEAVRRLPVHERVAVSLRYFEGRGVNEIAQITGRPVGTVTKQLTRAIERLRGDLVPAGPRDQDNDPKERRPCRTDTWNNR